MDIPALALAFGKSFLLALAAVLPILNPPASAPVFVNLTRGLDGATRAGLARRIGLNAALMLVGAMLVGTYVLDFFGVSLPIVRVAGGLIVAVTAWGMLYAQQVRNEDKAQMAESLTQDNVRIQAFYPMTFPLTCGPGSISAAITVGAALHSKHWATSAANFAGGLTALAVIGVLIMLTFRYAGRILRPLGEVGLIVFLRLTAFILLCVGVQIFWDGASELIRAL
jgi:multiple antibiotic resistance protein